MKIAEQVATLHRDVEGSFYVMFSDDRMKYYLNYPSNIFLNAGVRIGVNDLPKHVEDNEIKISDEIGVHINVYESHLSMIPMNTKSRQYIFIMHGIEFDFAD